MALEKSRRDFYSRVALRMHSPHCRENLKGYSSEWCVILKATWHMVVSSSDCHGNVNENIPDTQMWRTYSSMYVYDLISAVLHGYTSISYLVV